MPIMQRFLSPFREFGILSGFLYLLDQLFARANLNFRVCDYELMVQPIAEKAMAPANLTRSFEVRQINEGDPLLEKTPPPASVIEDRFRQSAVCLGAFQKGEFIGYQWLTFGNYEEDEVRCTFVPQPADQCVFDFDFYLYPEHRLGLGFVALWDGANRYLRERGIRYTTSRVSRFNTASRKSHQHLGWRCVGRAAFFAGRRVQLMLASVAPYCHLSFSTRSRPQIAIDADRG
jgi:hypothetical protein